MHPFLRGLITEWRRLKLPTSDETVVVAVSGGADSVSLLLAMHELVATQKLGLRLVAAHFDHHLRGDESQRDEEFVRSLTSERRIELALGGKRISTEGNVEQNARNARYTFLGSTARNLGAFAVLTGHTVNDQAETFLLNLVRGSGIQGLSAMRSVRPFTDDIEMGDDTGPSSKPLLLVRPLLTWAKRRATEGFCHDKGVEYRYDTMNEDTAFKRVRIRKVLLPLLEDLNPNIVETLANTAFLMQHSADQADNGEMLEMTEELELKILRNLPQPALFRTLRHWLDERRGTSRRLELKHIQAVERLLLSEKSGRAVELPGGDRAVRTGGRLVFEKNKVEN